MRGSSDHLHLKKSRSNRLDENERPSASSNSESLAEHRLPGELITEIILHLPVKSLLKFKCVSKSWLSLISSPQFIRSHFSTSSREGQYLNHHLLFTTLAPNAGIKQSSLYSAIHDPSSAQVSVIEYPFQNPQESLWIVGIVNGLVCLAIEERDLFLWNPVLKKSKHLPSSNATLKDGSYVIYGFGYDESNDDYKVVSVLCVYSSGIDYQTEVKVYSLREDSWRGIDCFKGGLPLDDTGKYANGKIHWTASGPSGSTQNWNIVTLDMVSEEYGELQHPDYEAGVHDWAFGVSGGRPFVLYEYTGVKTDLWVMDKYGVQKSWSKVVSIPCDVEPLKSYPLPEVLCILRNCDIVLVNGSTLLVYHSKHKEFRNIQLVGCSTFFEVVVYVESLVVPNAHDV